MKTRRCCTLFPTPRPVPERPRGGERVHSGDTPREGHVLVGRAASWAAGDPDTGHNGAAFAAFQGSHHDGGGELQAAPVALGFPGIPPLTSEVLAEAMHTLESCLRAPKASSGSLADGGGADPVPALAPRPVRGGAPTQPDAAVLAEELRKEGVRLVKVGQPAAAELVYTEAIKVAPRTPMLFFNRAACYARLGRHADALADARMGIQLAPTVPRGHWQEALALEAQGRYDEALGAYERAVTAARDSHADEATLREYESRRDALLRTAMGQKDAAARVARVLKDAENGRNTRGMLPEARRAAAVLREGP
jgi:tetratricopeptide (TPR) repeat protein